MSGSEQQGRFAVNDATEAQLIEKTHELARFTRYLQLLHKLSTTNYPHISALFADYLQTGREIFGTAKGAIFEWKGSGLYLRASCGPAVEDPHGTAVFSERQTLIVEASSELYVGTPLLIGGAAWGAISFWEANGAAEEALHPQSKEIIELIAKSIGIAIHQRQLTDQLAYQARHDALTGLPNRLHMQERLDRAIADLKDREGTLAVAFIDLDRFKQINDTLGHGAGDRVLQQIASRLRNCLQPGDTLARMGGDEFTAILTAADSNQALKTIRKLLAAVRAPCRVGEHELFVTASIGVSFCPRHGDDAVTLLRNADSAMYTAKYRGKNEVHQYDEAKPTAMRRLGLENDLRRAVERDELKVHYQPQVELTGKLAGLEVLLVWNHPERGRISPGEFIPIAEETGMILTIGSWVLREACRQIAEWRQASVPAVPVSVNVSALQFAQANFVPTVAGVLAYSSVPPGLLMLELTESLVMREIDQSISVMRQVRDLGVRIAIDDFGTGYSSLSYVRELPADALKIDRSFLDETGRPGSSLALIRAITALAHTFGLSVTAEGVETAQHLKIVREAGCDHVQGLLFGGPLAVDIIEGFLRDPLLTPDRVRSR